ncbi:MAG TPA: HyaD/HybD family hydrogenase maturation endopeptidase [Longimicrobiales bacterium]
MIFPQESGPTVVLGLGNPLMSDDGLGLAALARLNRDWAFTPGVDLIDGGTWGMNLLHIIEQAGNVLLIDAINVGAAPGTLITLERAELPLLFQLKLSPHQIDLREVLALAEWRGRLPAQTCAIGAQPDKVELGTELSPLLETRLDAVVANVIARLASWRHGVHRRAGATPGAVRIPGLAGAYA